MLLPVWLVMCEGMCRSQTRRMAASWSSQAMICMAFEAGRCVAVYLFSIGTQCWG